MAQQEFEAYMNGEIASVSAWESALVACEGMHQLREHLSLLKDLSDRTRSVQESTTILAQDIVQFKVEISEKVEEVLVRTPLIIKPRKTCEDLKIEASAAIQSDLVESSPIIPNTFYLQNLQIGQQNIEDTKNKLQLDITSCITDEKLVKPSQSVEFSLTPDEPNTLSKINYDIDFSDQSAENSMAELTPEKRKSPSFTPDPFSPVGSECTISQEPLVPAKIEAKKKDDFVLPFVEDQTLIEEENNDKLELPSPIKPISAHYSGFSQQGSQIPSIPCITGDFTFFNTSQNSNQPSTSQSSRIDDNNE